jgi:hypothetical protein
LAAGVFSECIAKTELKESDIALQQKSTTLQIISELRRRADSTSVKLADELERQLNEVEGAG